MRLFKPLEHLQAALKASAASKIPLAEQYAAVFRQLSYAGYLTFDSLVWANSVRFVTFTPQRAAKVNKVSQRFWLAGILFSIAAGALKASSIKFLIFTISLTLVRRPSASLVKHKPSSMPVQKRTV